MLLARCFKTPPCKYSLHGHLMGRQGVNIYARGDLQTLPCTLRKLNQCQIQARQLPAKPYVWGILRSLQGSYERPLENRLEQRHDHHIHRVNPLGTMISWAMARQIPHSRCWESSPEQMLGSTRRKFCHSCIWALALTLAPGAHRVHSTPYYCGSMTRVDLSIWVE